MKETKIKLIKAIIWFIIYVVATVLLFKVDWKIGLYVTIIVIAVYNDPNFSKKL